MNETKAIEWYEKAIAWYEQIKETAELYQNYGEEYEAAKAALDALREMLKRRKGCNIGGPTMELIERKALIEGRVSNDPVVIAAMCAPTIDPIRAAGGCYCRECRYWDEDGRCEPPANGLIREYTKPTDFCSYGKPREAQDDG